ncbi:MAG: hypothetical protein ACPG1C_13940 [Alphaproteobacteria bacterium]
MRNLFVANSAKAIMVGAAAGAVIMWGHVSATAGPAVSEPNAKVEVVGAEVNDDSAKALMGSITVPLGHAYGAQIDGMAGEIDDATATGIGGHLFWRDPDNAMLGITAAKARAFGQSTNRYGVEGELYRGDFTFSAFGGRQTGGGFGNMAYGGVAASWYATPNFLLQLSGDALDDTRSASLGFEWQPDTTNDGFTFFAKGTRGSKNAEAVQAGVRVYLGSRKNLKDRHRKDDPVNPLFNNLITLAGQSKGVACQVKLTDSLYLTEALGCTVITKLYADCDGRIEGIDWSPVELRSYAEPYREIAEANVRGQHISQLDKRDGAPRSDYCGL